MSDVFALLVTISHVLFDGLLRFFKNPEFGLFLSGLLAVCACVALLWFAITLTMDFIKLKRIIKIVANSKANGEDFGNEDSSVNVGFKASSKLKHGWFEFKEVLDFDSAKVPDCKVGNSIRPYEFLNPDDAEMTYPIFIMLANIFVGVGLFLTFVGLVAALTAAVDAMPSGVNIANSNASVEEALTNLLSAASVKFYASMTAIASSVILTLFVKFGEKSIRKQFYRLNSEIESRLDHQSLDSMARKTVELQSSQLEQLESLATDIGIKVGEQVADAVGKQLSSTFQPLIEQLENSAKEHQAGVGEMGAQFAQSFGQESKQSLAQLDQTIQQLNASMVGLAPALNSGATDLSANMELVITKMLDSFDKASTQMGDTLTQGSQQYIEIIEKRVSDIGDRFDATTIKLDQAAQTLQQGANNLVDNVAEHSHKAAEGIIDKLSTTSSELAGQAAEKISSAGKQAADTINHSISQLKESVSSLNQALGQSAQASTSLAGASNRQVESLTQISGGLSVVANNITQAITPFTNGVSQLNLANQAISKTTERLNLSMSDWTQFVESIDLAASSLNTTSEQLASSLDKHSSQFDGLDIEIANTFETVIENAQKIQTELINASSKIQKHYSEAVGQLSAAIEDFSEAIEENNNQVIKR